MLDSQVSGTVLARFLQSLYAAGVDCMLTAAYTPKELEAAIRAAGAQVEKHQNAGRSQQAREAFQEVRRLVALRSPETVEAMERERGLR